MCFFSVEVMRAGNPRFQFPLGYYPPVTTTNPDPSIDEPQTSVEQSWDPAEERRHGGSSSYQKETTPLKSSLLTAGHRFCWDPAWICFPPFQRGGEGRFTPDFSFDLDVTSCCGSLTSKLLPCHNRIWVLFVFCTRHFPDASPNGWERRAHDMHPDASRSIEKDDRSPLRSSSPRDDFIFASW